MACARAVFTAAALGCSAAGFAAGAEPAQKPPDHQASDAMQQPDHADAEQPAKADKKHGAMEGEPPYSTEPAPLRFDDIPDRPKPLLELGSPFLGQGPIGDGFTLPTGAVWQPSLLVFGTYRTAIQTFDNGAETSTEWVNRLDLFANLQLSGTERILVGMRPFDKNNRFTGFFLQPRGASQVDGESELNARLTHLFFEGDLGQIFPALDSAGGLDIGFSVGRQPLFYQEGMLIDDRVDAVGVTLNNLIVSGSSNLQMTLLYGWNNIGRDNNVEDTSANLYGFFTELDTDRSTLNFDTVFIHDDDRSQKTDAIYIAASAVQRIGHLNTSLRALASFPFNADTPQVSQGELLFAELSWTPPHSENLLYLDGFWGIDNFSSAARDNDAGGPLGRTGILFAAVGLGRYGAALGNQADHSVGAALGYQMFFDETRRQLILEAGARTDTRNDSPSTVAVASRFQQAIGRRTILRIGGFARAQDGNTPGYGARLELQFKF